MTMETRRTFTLAELLAVAVVCCIILVLAAGSAADAPGRAAAIARCQANLKELGVRMMLYADEQGVLPYASKLVGKDASYWDWCGLLYHAGYLETEKSSLLRCPSTPAQYGYNETLANVAGVPPSKNNRLWQEAALCVRDIYRPEVRILLGDARSSSLSGGHNSNYAHEGESANFLFLDGRAENYTRNAMVASYQMRLFFSRAR